MAISTRYQIVRYHPGSKGTCYLVLEPVTELPGNWYGTTRKPTTVPGTVVRYLLPDSGTSNSYGTVPGEWYRYHLGEEITSVLRE